MAKTLPVGVLLSLCCVGRSDHGAVDDATIWSRALSGAQIQTCAAGGDCAVGRCR